jgi:hypothetical protein
MSANQTASLPVNSISQALGFADDGFPSGKPNFETVKPNANGRWKEILSALGVDPATLKNHHGPCPGCGGKDRFRFDNLNGDGTFICSQGGLGETAGDGFELLVHAGKAASKSEALRLVADHLGHAWEPSKATPLRTTEYLYRRPDGSLNLSVTRLDTDDGGKTFRQLLPNGKPPKSDPTFHPYPYRINEWPAEGAVLVCEGEKCADALWQVGFTATTRAGGSSKWETDLTPHFEGRDVIILPDNDDAGRAYAGKVIEALTGTAKSLAVCELPDLPDKGDVIDWLALGNTPTQLTSLLEQAVPASEWAERTKAPLVGMHISDWLALEIEEREWLHDWIPPGFTMLAGAPKAGKSKLAEFVARNIAVKEQVLYLALEYNEYHVTQRFLNFEEDLKLHLCGEGQIPRWHQGGLDVLDQLMTALRPKLVVIDTFARIKKPGEKLGYEGELDAITSIKTMMDAHQCDCLLLHHTRKSSANDNADDLFERILGSTALAATPDNLQIIQFDGQYSTLHAKGRTYAPFKKVLQLEGDDFVEVPTALSDLQGNANAQEQVLMLLSKQGPMKCSDLVRETGKLQPQISSICKTLKERGAIEKLPDGSFQIRLTQQF